MYKRSLALSLFYPEPFLLRKKTEKIFRVRGLIIRQMRTSLRPEDTQALLYLRKATGSWANQAGYGIRYLKNTVMEKGIALAHFRRIQGRVKTPRALFPSGSS